MRPKLKSHKYRLVPNCRKKNFNQNLFLSSINLEDFENICFLSKMPKRQDLDKESKT